ncbi:hypothetical protein BDV40DRAFT_301936 [Aspergillus tamarii]|uniref:Heterokaryon incompatibility domain-containing protein n=1 Tax=Aspergillus tamarii TaxID=41984 RepID=A0A5N6UQD2_ASPTM|nr:hypothetical protein BDV40DRAFT_301936 [Aspergillus tamarii]
MEFIEDPQSYNPMENPQVIQDDHTYAVVAGGTRVPCPPEGEEFAILSYTWRDYVPQPPQDETPGSPVEQKMRDMCVRAQLTGRKYVQLGTCFKFEGETVMPQDDMDILEYSWYRKAAVCLVYLRDVEYTEDENEILFWLPTDRWFTEPWALQELLASKQIYFYAQDGRCFQTTTKSALLHWLPQWTKIGRGFLKHPDSIRHACIATSLSWAATRNCTTQEVVHSLKGIFGVRMTRRLNETMTDAFRRLQIKLIQKFPQDFSIYAWKVHNLTVPRIGDTLLAASPVNFSSCSQIQLHHGLWPSRVHEKGDEHVIMELPFIAVNDGTFLLCLNCYQNDPVNSCLSIRVRLMPATFHYERVDVTKIDQWIGNSNLFTVLVESSGRVSKLCYLMG